MRYLVKDKSQQAVVINIQCKQSPGGPLDPGYRHCSAEHRVGWKWRVLQCRVFVPLYLCCHTALHLHLHWKYPNYRRTT